MFDFPAKPGDERMMKRFAELSGPLTPDAQQHDTAAYIDFLAGNECVSDGAMGVVGYRVAMLVSGALALVLVDGSDWFPALGWHRTYLAMAALMGIGVIGTVWGREPAAVPAPRTLRAAVADPFREFFTRPGALWLLALIVLYKLGDAFAGSLTTAFLLRGAEFSLGDVGKVYKVVGFTTTIVGVVRHVRNRTLEARSRVEVYWPASQRPSSMTTAARSRPG